MSNTTHQEESHSGQQSQGEDLHEPTMSIISVADFDGNGEVNTADIEDITSRSNSSDGDNLYHPLYDLDTNGIIDDNDIAIANGTLGQDVPLIDQQIAQATQATIKYYGSGGLEQALFDGYIPFTQEVQGHGIHYFNFPLALEVAESPNLNINTPIGLNYDAEGNLLAVFYIRTPYDPIAALENPAAFVTIDPENDFPPTSFDGISAEDWHTHENIWFSGLGSLNPEDTYGFEEEVPIEATISRFENIGFQQFPESDQVFSPKFWMLHGWFHSLNLSGTFANLNPHVSLYAPIELGAHSEHEDDVGHNGGGHQEGEHSEGHSENGSGLIAGTDLDDGLHGTEGDDRINTFDGDDWIHGGLGDDSIWGGQGHDWLAGDDIHNPAEGGEDMLYGGPGSDAIYGQIGDDRLFGGTGDDFIVGGEGNDLLRGGLGYDNLTGSEDADSFVLVSGEGTDTIHDFEIDLDTIILYGGITIDDVSIAQSGSNTILNANDETLAILRGVNADELIATNGDAFLVA